MSNNINLLISPSVLKTISGIDDNIDDGKLFPVIYRSQYTHIQEALGTDLYNKVLNDKIGQNLTGKYEILYNNYIVPCLIEWCLYNMTLDLSLPITNKGIMRPNSSNSNAASVDELRLAQTTRSNSAEFWTQRVINYCKEHCNDLKEYHNNNGLDKIHPENTAYDSGIYFQSNSNSRRNNRGSRWR